ncbi:MAG: hypothetical protein K0S53_1112 [Bacteroidetes bacterium]|jgi:hypothetical protein|nr:hypothetical protein [Bacteroidota bacterium]MDF2452224.1 hypothetical protein [Bacteroidota bacterium]
MAIIRHILLSVFTIAVLYFLGMFVLKTVPYSGKPAIYITNNYYNWKGGDTYEKYREFSKTGDYDIVVAGSSRAYRGYSPFLFDSAGYNCFNLGTSAQSIKNTYFIVKHYLDSANCQLLIIDVFAGAFTKNQLESSSDLVENLNDPAAAYDVAMHNKDIRTLNIATLRFLTENDKPYFSKKDYSGKGYSEKGDSLSVKQQTDFFNRKKVTHKKIEIDEEQIRYFNKIVDLCMEKKLRVVFVYSPVSYFYDYSIHHSFVDMLKPSMEMKNVPFYDFSICDSINTAYHFYDESHLNSAGVKIFNRALVTKLKQDKILSDK